MGFQVQLTVGNILLLSRTNSAQNTDVTDAWNRIVLIAQTQRAEFHFATSLTFILPRLNPSMLSLKGILTECTRSYSVMLEEKKIIRPVFYISINAFHYY